MSGDGLDLNIGAAQADLGGINTQHGILETAAGDLHSESTNLFNGALLGSGADAGSDFSHRLNSALQGARDVVHAMNGSVGKAQEETVGFDRGGFAGNYA